MSPDEAFSLLLLQDAETGVADALAGDVFGEEKLEQLLTNELTLEDVETGDCTRRAKPTEGD